ncbi:MAG: hypothetical protein JO199_01820 [Candidatus Eremiobacteraeota bacterium]|nr:hypothetical protein [Candidatus Eremiobacteraeota bacterium]
MIDARIAALVAAAFIFCSSVAIAQVPVSHHAVFDGTAIQPDSQSQIELTKVFVLADPIQAFAADTQTVECAFFINHGPKNVAHVRVRWTYTALEGDRAGEIVGSDTKDVWGTFAPGVPVETWPQNGNALGKQCQTVKAYFRNGKFELWKPKTSASLQAQVDAVGYADGTTWTPPTPQPSASP